MLLVPFIWMRNIYKIEYNVTAIWDQSKVQDTLVRHERALDLLLSEIQDYLKFDVFKVDDHGSTKHCSQGLT